MLKLVGLKDFYSVSSRASEAQRGISIIGIPNVEVAVTEIPRFARNDYESMLGMTKECPERLKEHSE